jgi:quinol-cytochrome oxidoreductase complex cytochrome b subunit
MAIGETIRNSQIWKSIFRHPMPLDRRNRIVVMLTNFFLHLHPVSIKKQGIALSFTWCMGGVTFFLFLVETVTGVLLMFYYRPTCATSPASGFCGSFIAGGPMRW